MKKTIGVLAHVDAGKTTFSEQLLYHTKSIQKRGRVDHKDAFLDNDEIERQRGITIFSGQGYFDFNDSRYYLIDTPGHIDFSAEMERAIAVMDYAIIIVSAVEGVQPHTKTVWKLLKEYNVPVIFFINKIDREGANVDAVLNSMQKEFSQSVVLIEGNKEKPFINFDDSLMETISEQDDELLEKYLEGDYESSLFEDKFKKFIKHRKIFPVFKGSALQDEGIEEFINALDEMTFIDYSQYNNILYKNIHNVDEDFAGYVYKVRYDDNGMRVTFIKCLKGSIKVKDQILYGENEENKFFEKVEGIRLYNGKKFKNLDSASEGDIVGVCGLTNAECGSFVGFLEHKHKYNLVPALMSKVIYDEKLNPKDVLNVFKMLEGEDPSLNVLWDEKLKEIHVHIMGQIQLEILKDMVKERFNLDVEFGKCEILYKETIGNTVVGSGHFEPLRHYAEAHLLMEPAKRNSGITFENKCSNDNLAPGFQNLIKTHVFERNHKGVLTGSDITDIKFTLLIGKAHLKHTCGGDFREATYRAIRQGLEKSEKILLEPYYKFTIEVTDNYVGKVMMDIEKLHGIFIAPEHEENKVIIRGRGPVATFMDYSMELIATTKGTGIISLVYDGYDVCHNSEEVIAKKAYDKDADVEYTSSSVFCSHGKGFIVKYDEADEMMHLRENIEEILLSKKQ